MRPVVYSPGAGPIGSAYRTFFGGTFFPDPALEAGFRDVPPALKGLTFEGSGPVAFGARALVLAGGLETLARGLPPTLPRRAAEPIDVFIFYNGLGRCMLVTKISDGVHAAAELVKIECGIASRRDFLLPEKQYKPAIHNKSDDLFGDYERSAEK